ncbi:ubiquitin-like domain-containing CTD phosphatase 1, partial [Phenoliferia sp. Uapishka_3]
MANPILTSNPLPASPRAKLSTTSSIKRKKVIIDLTLDSDSDDSDIEIPPSKKRSKLDNLPIASTSRQSPVLPTSAQLGDDEAASIALALQLFKEESNESAKGKEEEENAASLALVKQLVAEDETVAKARDEKARQQRFKIELELARGVRAKAASGCRVIGRESGGKERNGNVLKGFGGLPPQGQGVNVGNSVIQRKLSEVTDALKIRIMSEPRQGKKLLVLDIDHTILDCNLRLGSKNRKLFASRPFLHKFLAAISPFYDIVIWSATFMSYIKPRLIELGLIGAQRREIYPIVFILTKNQMFHVNSPRKSDPQHQHRVKALQVIWEKLPGQYGPESTIHVDDLKQNFTLNRGNGLMLRPYRGARNNWSTDRELAFVAKYLLQIEAMPDVNISQLDHSGFRMLSSPLPGGVADPVKTWKRSE